MQDLGDKDMRETDQIIHEFAGRLRQTEEYRTYEERRDRVREYPGLMDEINEFRKRNYLMQKSEGELFDKIDAFAREYEEFRSNPVVDQYLRAELAVCRMVQNIYTEIAEAIDVEITLDM